MSIFKTFPTLFMSSSAVIVDSPLRQTNMRIRQHVGGRARRPVGQQTVSSLSPFFAAPRVRLAWRLRNFAMNCHE